LHHNGHPLQLRDLPVQEKPQHQCCDDGGSALEQEYAPRVSASVQVKLKLVVEHVKESDEPDVPDSSKIQAVQKGLACAAKPLAERLVRVATETFEIPDVERQGD
jgi:hypothetical protein